MSRLPIDHPEVHQQFMHGGFSVQLGSQNPFGRISVDQTIEETVNRDTQTAGGTKGFSLKRAAVERYYLTSEYRSNYLKQLRRMVGRGMSHFSHPDLQMPRITRDEADVQSIVKLLEDDWTNPFDPMKQWSKFLRSLANKANLIRFLVAEWKTPKLRDRLNDKQLYVASEESCLHITKDQWAEVASLQSNQEEADTRMILNAAHAAEEGYSAVVVTADDTNVLLLCLAFSANISCPLFQNCGTKNRVRYLDMTKLRQALGDCVCNAVIGMYAYTGCDTLSAFAGRGKLRALKLIMRSEHFQEVFRKLGQSGELSMDLFKKLQAFTCKLYTASTTTEDINTARHQLFCAQCGELESSQLPPCESSATSACPKPSRAWLGQK
ncbi:hypothetical protein AAFF_G00331670 [Aldrovandia affinis]|uniref:Uncharacterized protein n=2 Tax=Aldrovandia affinis TaxID=143900 RepID=A0AAD7SLD4_9TELE|nr:hypothetical protein AAFF_G00331670 [Aldrovandia affinis]